MKMMRKPLSKVRSGWTAWIFCALLLPAWMSATAQASKGSGSQSSAALSAKVIAWTNANLASYKQAVAYAKNAPPPVVPVPPLIDPPCRSCDAAKTPTQGEAQVATWITQSEAPEDGYITTLLKIGKYLAQWEGAGDSLLSPAAEKALAQFSSTDAQKATERLSDRLLNGKAIPMAQKYDSEPKRAYAGISFLLTEARKAALIHGSGYSGPEQAVELATTWQQSIVKSIDNDVVAGHKYNLCPVYASVYKSLELLSGSGLNMDPILATMEKLQNLLTFDVKMNFQVTSHAKDGNSIDARWTGNARLKLKMKAEGSTTCYSPELEDGGLMDVSVDDFNWITKADGPLQLISARSFKMPLGLVQLNLCDPQPILQLPFAGVIPAETVSAKGHEVQTHILQSFLTAVIQANHTNRPEINAMTGKSRQASAEAESADGSALAPLVPSSDDTLAPLVPPSSYPSNDTPNDPIKNSMQDVDNKQQNDELKAAQAQLTAHRGDSSWMMSAAGQAAIANLQKLAMAKAQAKLAGAGVVVPNSNNMIDLANAVYSAQLPWNNGSAQPVNELLKVHKDQATIYLTITVQQAAQ